MLQCRGSNRKFKSFYIASWMLVALTFVVWLKVTTDIFFIDALMLCIAGDYEDEEDEEDAKPVLPSDIGIRNL